MRVYHASLTLNLLKKYFELFREPLNILLSVALMGGDSQGFLIDNRNMVDSLIGDSGAWSVVMGKSTLTLEALINYLLHWGHYFDLYFNFDTTFEGDFKNNMLNQLEMESHGLTPVPVIHDFFGNEIPDYVNSGKYPGSPWGRNSAGPSPISTMPSNESRSSTQTLRFIGLEVPGSIGW